METFVIADTHFGHNNIARYSPCRDADSCEHHTEILVKNWNSVVGIKDKVICLGDFVFGAKHINVCERLNGKKILIMGNHDTYSTDKYLKYFDKLLGSMEYKDGILTHIPIHETELKRYKFNIHGHLHGKKLVDQRYINVSCEQINSTPLNIKLITEINN